MSGPPQLPAHSLQGCACADPQGQRATPCLGSRVGVRHPLRRRKPPLRPSRGRRREGPSWPPWPAGSGCSSPHPPRPFPAPSVRAGAALVRPGAVRHEQGMGVSGRSSVHIRCLRLRDPTEQVGSRVELRSASGPSRHGLTREKAQTGLPFRVHTQGPPTPLEQQLGFHIPSVGSSATQEGDVGPGHRQAESLLQAEARPEDTQVAGPRPQLVCPALSGDRDAMQPWVRLEPAAHPRVPGRWEGV